MPNPLQRLLKQSSSGFSLLELSIVLMIIGAFAGTGMLAGKSMLESAKVASTNNRLNMIETALLAYRQANNRIPCPGDASLLPSSTNYGKEAGRPGFCIGGTPTVNFYVVANSVNTVEGSVPTRALNLPDEVMYDGWGRKFAYSAWASFTKFNGFLDYGLSTNCGMSTISGSSGVRSTRAAYTLLSFGPNGHGGYLSSGERMSVGSTNVDELANCHCDSSGASVGYAAVYVIKDATADPANSRNSFDDIVRFKERWQLQSYLDEVNPGGNMTCPLPPVATPPTCPPTCPPEPPAPSEPPEEEEQIPPDDNPYQCAAGVAYGTGGGLCQWYGGNESCGGNEGAGFLVRASEDPVVLTRVAEGDINGDGIRDMAFLEETTRKVYVLFGTASVFPSHTTLEPGLLDGTNGFVATPIKLGNTNCSGSVMITDINRDGYGDLVVGSPCARFGGDTVGGQFPGSVYVLYGKATWNATVDMSTMNGTDGFRMDGGQQLVNGSPEYFGHAGRNLGTGDFNADGYQDILIAGQMGYYTYVVFGSNNLHNAVYTLDDNATTGLIRNGLGTRFGADDALTPPENSSGINPENLSVAGGDLNGDNIDDMVISYGSTYASPHVYIIFGKAGAWPATFAYTSLNGTNGTQLYGTIHTYPFSGYPHETHTDSDAISIAVGDINGDHIDDLAMTTVLAEPFYYPLADGKDPRRINVLYGHTSAWPATQSIYDTFVTSPNAATGFTLVNNVGEGGTYGPNLAFGDFNGDGISDLAITNVTSPEQDNCQGKAYVVFGATSGWGTINDLTDFGDGIKGVRFDAMGMLADFEQGGAHLSDINRDGRADLIVASGISNLPVRVIYGQRVSPWPSPYNANSTLPVWTR